MTRKSDSYWLQTSKQLTASVLTGWTEASLTYPAEYVKVMLQLDGKGKERRFQGAADVVRQTVRSYGPLGMYRGYSVVFCGNVPKYACRFGAFEQLKRHFADSNGQLSPFNRMLCGLGAGLVEALFAVIPIESIKVKFINDRCSAQPQFRGLVHGVKEIIRERGLGAMYTGAIPTLLKQGSNQAIRFFVFESLKDWSTARNGSATTKSFIPAFGLMAGAASVLFNAPIDTVKTRMQGLQASRYQGTLDCVQQIYAKEGLLAFYKGASVRMVKCGCEVAIAFTMYNTFLDLLK